MGISALKKAPIWPNDAYYRPRDGHFRVEKGANLAHGAYFRPRSRAAPGCGPCRCFRNKIEIYKMGIENRQMAPGPAKCSSAPAPRRRRCAPCLGGPGVSCRQRPKYRSIQKKGGAEEPIPTCLVCALARTRRRDVPAEPCEGVIWGAYMTGVLDQWAVSRASRVGKLGRWTSKVAALSRSELSNQPCDFRCGDIP